MVWGLFAVMAVAMMWNYMGVVFHSLWKTLWITWV